MTITTHGETTDMETDAKRIIVVVNHRSIFDPRPTVPGFQCTWINRNARTGRTEYVFYPDWRKDV